MKNYLRIIIASTAFAGSFTAMATDNEYYKFVGLGLNHYDNLANLDLSHTEIDLVPEIFFGLGKKYQLNEDWQLSNEISLHYAKTHFSGFVENDRAIFFRKL